MLEIMVNLVIEGDNTFLPVLFPPFLPRAPVHLDFSHLIDSVHILYWQVVHLRQILFDFWLAQVRTASEGNHVFFVGFWAPMQHHLVIQELYLLWRLLEPGCDSGLQPFWVHVLFKFKSLLVVFVEFHCVCSALRFWGLEVTELGVIDIFYFSGLPHVEVELISVESKPFHF